MLMLGSVAVALAILTQYAGAWGVPYFTFTTDRGSTCKNGLAGYTCSAMTLADVEYIGNVDLPDDSSVVASTYRSTHDYQMEAVIDDEDVVDVGDGLGQAADDLDCLFHGRAFEDGGVFRLHQAAGGVAVVRPDGHVPSQQLHHLPPALVLGEHPTTDTVSRN